MVTHARFKHMAFIENATTNTQVGRCGRLQGGAADAGLPTNACCCRQCKLGLNDTAVINPAVQAYLYWNRQQRQVCVAFRGTEQGKWRDILTDLHLVPAPLDPDRVAEARWTAGGGRQGLAGRRQMVEPLKVDSGVGQACLCACAWLCCCEHVVVLTPKMLAPVH